MQLVIIIIGKEQKPQIQKTYENRNENTFMEEKLSARTTGRARRAIKKAIIPDYGQKGMGWLYPKKALYNRVYRQTTFSLFDQLKAGSVKKQEAVVDCPPEWTQEVLVASETVPLFIT